MFFGSAEQVKVEGDGGEEAKKSYLDRRAKGKSKREVEEQKQ